MSEPPPLPQRKSERRLDMLDGQAVPLAPALPLMRPPPLPPRKSEAIAIAQAGVSIQLQEDPLDTSREEAGEVKEQHASERKVGASGIPPSVVVAVQDVPPVEVPEESLARHQVIQEGSSLTKGASDSLNSRPASRSTAAPTQEVEMPSEETRNMPSVPEPNTPASRRTQASRPTTPQSSAIPLSASTQNRSLPTPVPAQIAAKRAASKGPFTHAPLDPNQDPHIPLPMPSLPVVLLLAIPITLAYLRVSFVTLLLGLLFSWYIWAEWKRKKTKRTDFGPEVDRAKTKGLNAKWEHEHYNEESVFWMNHALRALFPLINTDILTPFIDLVEDALLTQVPPIISSVRLVSPSLGEEPIQIVSMRPMSDAEWFDNLSKAPSAPANRNGKLMGTLDSFRKKILPGGSAATGDLPDNEQPRPDGGSDAKVRSMEVDERRKRDRILRMIGGRRGQGVGVSEGRDSAQKQQGGEMKGHRDFSEGTHVRGEEDTGDEDQDGGEYVNFAVDFSYDGRKNRNGWDLHFLCYMGIGMKGLGGGELPIWVEMLKITGTMHVRLLLAPDVPFVRTASISLPQLPDFDLAIKPIKDLSLDFFGLPFLKPFMEKAILEVADGFVRPNSYRLDVDRLLLGEEAALRTEAIGVLHIRVHRAEGLKAADTFGSSDPYATVAFSKLSKPVFSTRTIVDSLNPRWEEDAYVLVVSDAIESGERIRIVVYDADRFSADDAIGMVDIDLADLLEKGNHRSERKDMMEEQTDLVPTKNGMPAQGRLFWSHAFYPLWKMPEDGKAQQAAGEEEWQHEKHGNDDIGTGREGQVQMPGLIYSLMGRLAPDPFPWEAERRKRRMESIAWLTGERARETLEASVKPSMDRRSGILQFAITQCNNLEYQRTGKTFASQSSKRHSGAAGGRPAQETVVDSMPWEQERPPSAYAEVILNGRLVYRTRTKQINPSPYWNATGERFIRDWSKARLVVVIRDERDRENDPILGLVSIELSTAFSKACQLTRTYPLLGGLGWGTVRISLLFKAVDAQLPHGISSYEVATIRLNSLSMKRPPGWSTNKLSVIVETDSDSKTISYDTDAAPAKRRQSLGRKSISSTHSVASMNTVLDQASDPTLKPEILDWRLEDRGVVNALPVEYRHSCFLLFRFMRRSGRLKKDIYLGMACIRLQDIPDNSACRRTVPIYNTDDINQVCDLALNRAAALERNEEDPQKDLPMVNIGFNLFAGISRAHRKLAKRDKRLAHVYEAWQAAQDDDDTSGRSADGKIANPGQYEDAEVAPADLGEMDDYDEPTSAFGKWLEHNRLLGRQHKGLMQNKLMRNLKFGKDKVQSKVLGGQARATRKKRPHGADIDMEMEGISKI
ncbi:hypothetical protein FFLO_02333 [Filobasidium floriforme]|uniref:C2 domain-containing protein n=1 Tax=Filobasidium floriforme TaxID=5210 RepID=A0A8K0NU50_9TREE|nr:uncharacterized protein HD553DRAFT_299705 [Filobasidium floriforme]KAG7562247.1 hypothetical protein FFLO_02333 [Filobasidium floriforme]KAH8080552.1 hypothetical protein HD553DRAFT_299705 [Filobasidium floriforme]